MIDLSAIEIPVTGTVAFWKSIGKALEDLPFKEAYPLITTIDRQLNGYIASLQPAPEPAAPTAPDSPQQPAAAAQDQG